MRSLRLSSPPHTATSEGDRGDAADHDAGAAREAHDSGAGRPWSVLSAARALELRQSDANERWNAKECRRDARAGAGGACSDACD